MDEVRLIHVEVAYARPEEQVIVHLRVGVNCTAEDAIRASKILARFEDIDLRVNKIGVFGQHVELDTVLREGDRVEIYRPLIVDPKEARRRRAAAAQDHNKA